MKFSEYLESIITLAKSSPRLLELEVISAADDEGNYFDVVHNAPTAGYFDGRDYIAMASRSKHGYIVTNKIDKKPNAICIN